MANKIQPNIYKITLLLLLGLCLGLSGTLYAAQNDEIDDEKKEDIDHNGPGAEQNNPNNQASKPIALIQNFQDLQKKGKEKAVTVWSCPMCTLENTLEDTKCVTCGTTNPEWLRHNQKQPAKLGHSPISVTFINHEALLLVSYRFNIMFNNSACEISHTYNSLYTAHQHIIKTYKVAAKRLVFPVQLALSNENIVAYYFTQDNTYYANHGKQLQQYLSSLLSIYYKTKNEGILDVLGLWICDICKIFNNRNINKQCIKCESEQLKISVRKRHDSYFDSVYDYWYKFTISVAYTDDILLAYVLAKAIQYINNAKDDPDCIYFIKSIGGSSFVGKNIENKITSTANHEWDAVVKKKITTWRKDEIIKKGLEIAIEDRYHHAPKETKITCPNINDAHQEKYSGLGLALQCPIYRDAKEHYKFSENVKNHLHFFSHFLDEYNEKAVCRHGAACKSFIRLEHNGNLIKDLCHIQIYRHPPRRNRPIQLNETIHQFVYHQNENDNKPLYGPTDDEQKNLLRLLLDEVIDNGYKYDLCFACNKKDKYKLFVTGYIKYYYYKKQNIAMLSKIIEDIQSFNGSTFMFECKHNVKNKKNKNSLISIISKKFDHTRYKKMGKPFHGSGYTPDALMLSLILYTGGDCNYDLCAAQRNGDYDKWKIFDLCLWKAIHCLSQKEYGSYKLYSGLKNIKITERNIKSGYFPTYTSTTVYKDIAKRFAGEQGMMIEVDQAVRNAFICCDVSWISKFGVNESEVLIARTVSKNFREHPVNNFFVQILDDKLGVQTVLLTKRPSYDLACKDIILKISHIIGGKESGTSKLSYASVSPIFKQLIAGEKEVPYQARKSWDAFRHQQQRITIDMKYMYYDYKAFIPLLFDTKCKNLLLFDKIANIFPNVTEIICENTDYVGKDEKEYNRDKYGYSADIVCSNFILGLKDGLSKMHKQAKLIKIIIQTKEHEIGDKCKLYTTEFRALGCQIGKGRKTIVITRNRYDFSKISSMIGGAVSSYDATPLDMPISIFKKLIADDKDIPADVQKQWNDFRHKQQRITINMKSMYQYYKAFMPLLIDINCKNLLLLDTIAKLFPNVTEIICGNTDYVGKDAAAYKPNVYGYSSAIVCSNFILGEKERLSKMDKHAKLTKIVIQTDNHEIKDDCKLYAPQFGALGWKIGKGSKVIAVTKEPYEVRCKEVIDKISSMVQGDEPFYEATSLDVPIFKQLIVGATDISADVQKEWNAFRHQQQRITIDMRYMYKYYKAFMPPLCAPKCKNLLLLDKIAQLFPNVTEIIYKEINYVGWNELTKSSYSAAIVCSNFMLGVKECLSKMDKQAKLTKIIIKTWEHEIGDDCKLYPTQFGALRWHIGKKSKTILLKPYKVIWKEAIAKIKSMIQANSPSYDATPLDVPIFNNLDVPIFKKLIAGAKDLPADVQKQWNVFRHQQQRITINIEYMYDVYKAFMPLLFDPKCKNLLLLDKIAQLFPNVTEIICRETDYIGIKDRGWGRKYSADIVCSNFILGVKECLSKMDKQAKLTKIVIQTYQHEIKYDYKLYSTQFGALGWQVQRGSYENKYGLVKKNRQITLTRLQKPNAQADTNKQKPNNHQSVDNEVFDID